MTNDGDEPVVVEIEARVLERLVKNRVLKVGEFRGANLDSQEHLRVMFLDMLKTRLGVAAQHNH